MKYVFDLDETLIQSSTLNNDAYNYALEKFGYPRIITSERITREKLNFISLGLLRKIIKEKQKYFTSEWLPYRTTINVELVEMIKIYGRKNCYLWTKSSIARAKAIFRYYTFEKLFHKVIFDDKFNFSDSIHKLKTETHSNKFIIYENNHDFFEGQQFKEVYYSKTKMFNVVGYHIIL